MLQIICLVCKKLVEVRDRVIADHDDCPMSGVRYLPSPRRFQAGPGAPSIDIVGAKMVEGTCENGHHHKGIFVVAQVGGPDPRLN